MGGEKARTLIVQNEPQGSPPHGRGKDGKFIRINESTGITPAWAGKRKEQLDGVKKSEDHPRVGGEKLGPVMLIKAVRGSPPRGRGKVNKRKDVIFLWRITPAWAGKRQPRRPSNRDRRDHPRVGGEKPMPQRSASHLLGSPPRRRGKVEPTNQDGKTNY